MGADDGYIAEGTQLTQWDGTGFADVGKVVDLEGKPRRVRRLTGRTRNDQRDPYTHEPAGPAPLDREGTEQAGSDRCPDPGVFGAVGSAAGVDAVDELIADGGRLVADLRGGAAGAGVHEINLASSSDSLAVVSRMQSSSKVASCWLKLSTSRSATSFSGAATSAVASRIAAAGGEEEPTASAPRRVFVIVCSLSLVVRGYAGVSCRG